MSTSIKIEHPDFTEWRNNFGDRHREDGPAYIHNSGTQQWWINGKCHRSGGPAIIWPNGSVEWWDNDKQHRLDGPAMIWTYGNVEWWINDFFVAIY
jgi:hypothetical protein